jgi:hypothetical protein
VVGRKVGCRVEGAGVPLLARVWKKHRWKLPAEREEPVEAVVWKKGVRERAAERLSKAREPGLCPKGMVGQGERLCLNCQEWEVVVEFGYRFGKNPPHRRSSQ